MQGSGRVGLILVPTSCCQDIVFASLWLLPPPKLPCQSKLSIKVRASEMSSGELVQCYNRGCGQKFDPTQNKEDCRHHPGDPVFHDAYKGWSCCNKKCTDFTEFLNIKGCTVSKHSNEKPPEPEKPTNNLPDTDVIEVKPIVKASLDRPPFDSPMTLMKPEVAASLKQQISSPSTNETVVKDPNEIAVGTICKNGGCNMSYAGPDMEDSPCVHHPGYPVFHEGMKFWSCCTKRTSDFNAFLNQIGCETGKHLWIKEEKSEAVTCRWDYHQTGTHVIVSIYAKQYSADLSEIKLNPIRLYANVVFPQQANAAFNLDLELQGVVDVKQSQVNMFGTKVEIKLRKAEPGSWSRLEVPRQKKVAVGGDKSVEVLEEQVEGVDLSDL